MYERDRQTDTRNACIASRGKNCAQGTVLLKLTTDSRFCIAFWRCCTTHGVGHFGDICATSNSLGIGQFVLKFWKEIQRDSR